MESVDKLSPKIRFHDNEYEPWEAVTLGEIATVIRGSSGLSKASLAEDGRYACILYGQLFRFYGSVIKKVMYSTNTQGNILSKKGDILMPTSDVTSDGLATASCILVDDVVLGGDMNIIRLGEGIDPIFMTYYIRHNKKPIVEAVVGTTVKHIYPKDISKITYFLPSLPEQEKIANFFSALDENIDVHKSKLELLTQQKQGYMQQVFSRKLRFHDDNGNEYGEWEETTLGEIAKVKRGASPRPIADPKWFSPKGERGWVRISDVSKSNKSLLETTQYLSKEGIEKSVKVEVDELILSIAGSVGKPSIVKIPVCVHDGFIVFKNLQTNVEFLYYFLEKSRDGWKNFSQASSQANLNAEIVSDLAIAIPSLPEQEKIASFFSTLDENIDAVARKMELLKEQKQGYMQRMFL